MTINWFPGHMNKARREIAEAMRQTSEPSADGETNGNR